MGRVIDRVAPSERTVGTKEGQVPWTREAITVLRETASVYNATITYQELAEQVQRRSGLRTKVQPRSWLGAVLRTVIMACHAREIPPLSALVVKADGQVGNAYDEVLKITEQPLIADPIERERHAAQARLDCYRRFCESVPEDAVPTLTAQVKAKSERVQRAPRKPPVVELRAPACPRCFLQLPLAGGECPNCD